MMKFMLLLLTNVLLFGLVDSAGTWKPASDKMVDIGIVIDQNQLGLNDHPGSSDSEVQEWYNNLRNQPRTAFVKLVEDVITLLMETKSSEVNARIAIMFHNYGTRLKLSYEETKGKSPAEITMVLNNFDMQAWPERTSKEGRTIMQARQHLNTAQGKRPGVPGFLLWFGVHRAFNSPPFEPLVRLRQHASGPDLVISVESTQNRMAQVSMVGNGIDNIAVNWDNTAPSQIFSSILKILSTCSMEMQETPCYFQGENESCVLEKMYQAMSGNDVNQLRYCFDSNSSTSCQYDECQANCDEAPREPMGQCSVTCGEGMQETRPNGYLTDKFVEHCPKKNEKCDTGVKCPDTGSVFGTVPSTGNGTMADAEKSSPLETYQIVLIFTACLVVILFFACMCVFFGCVCKKTESERRPPKDNRQGFFQQSRLASNRSRSPGSRSSRRHKSSKPSPRDPSATPLDVSQDKKLDEVETKKGDPGAYIDLTSQTKKPAPYLDLTNESKKPSPTGYRDLVDVQLKQPIESRPDNRPSTSGYRDLADVPAKTSPKGSFEGHPKQSGYRDLENVHSKPIRPTGYREL